MQINDPVYNSDLNQLSEIVNNMKVVGNSYSREFTYVDEKTNTVTKIYAKALVQRLDLLTRDEMSPAQLKKAEEILNKIKDSINESKDLTKQAIEGDKSSFYFGKKLLSKLADKSRLTGGMGFGFVHSREKALSTIEDRINRLKDIHEDSFLIVEPEKTKPPEEVPEKAKEEEQDIDDVYDYSDYEDALSEEVPQTSSAPTIPESANTTHLNDILGYFPQEDKILPEFLNKLLTPISADIQSITKNGNHFEITFTKDLAIKRVTPETTLQYTGGKKIEFDYLPDQHKIEFRSNIDVNVVDYLSFRAFILKAIEKREDDSFALVSQYAFKPITWGSSGVKGIYEGKLAEKVNTGILTPGPDNTYISQAKLSDFDQLS